MTDVLLDHILQNYLSHIIAYIYCFIYSYIFAYYINSKLLPSPSLKIDNPIRFLYSCPLLNFWSKGRGRSTDSKSENMQLDISQSQLLSCCGTSFT